MIRKLLKQLIRDQIKCSEACAREYGWGELSPEHLDRVVDKFMERITPVLVKTVPTNCPYCDSPHFHVAEIDIGEYREWYCLDCKKLFWGKNPSWVEELEGEEIADICVRDYILNGDIALGYSQWKDWPKSFLDAVPKDGNWHCIEHSNISESYWIDGVQYPYVR